MPRTASKRKAPVRRRRAPIRRRRVLRRNVPDKASCSEVLQIVDARSNTMYGNAYVSLGEFPRSSLISEAYQEYRITNVKWTFKPQFDTFIANTDATTAYRVPQLHYMIDKAATLPPTTTFADLVAMGAKPHRFDDKNITVSYAPGVVLGVDAAGSATIKSAMKKVSPWLSTTDAIDASWAVSTAQHNGLFYYLDAAALPGDGVYEYSVSVEVQVEFRKPFLPVGAGNTVQAIRPQPLTRTLTNPV